MRGEFFLWVSIAYPPLKDIRAWKAADEQQNSDKRKTEKQKTEFRQAATHESPCANRVVSEWQAKRRAT